MKTLQDYIDKLNALNFKAMCNNDFFWTWDKTDEELEDLMLEREDGYYCVPEECCPICQFIEYSNCDLARFLEREYKVSRDEVFAKVKALNKRRKKLYDSEYVTEVCSRFNLNPAEIVSGLKNRFGTYRHFRDYISSR